MIVTVSLTTIAWLATTSLTPSEPQATLENFYRRVRPHGRGWGPIAAATGVAPAPGSLGGELLNALLGCVLVYAALFGVGQLLLRSAIVGVALLAVSALAAFAIARNLVAEER
jgi:SSS family solute:Na+ symporter